MAAGMYSPLPFAAAQVCGAWSDAASNSLLQLLATQQQPVCRLLFKSSMHLNVLFASAVLLQQLQWCAMHLTYLLCLCQSLQVLVELPYVILQSLLYGTITYMLVHFELSAAKFWWYILFTFLTLLFFTYYGEGPRRYVAVPVFCRMAPPRGGRLTITPAMCPGHVLLLHSNFSSVVRYTVMVAACQRLCSAAAQTTFFGAACVSTCRHDECGDQCQHPAGVHHEQQRVQVRACAMFPVANSSGCSDRTCCAVVLTSSCKLVPVLHGL
jgi:hypothetical protein